MENGQMPELNMERIKAYNDDLKTYQDKATKLKAEQEFTRNELAKICNELSTELGIQVTPDNIEQVYKERLEKMESSLAVGEEILRRIKAEEQGQTPVATVNATQQPIPTAPVQPQQQYYQPQIPVTPAGQQPAPQSPFSTLPSSSIQI